MLLQRTRLVIGSGILLLNLVSAGAAQVVVTADARLTPNPPSFGDSFGSSIALSENTLVVGAPQHSFGAGRVFVYVRAGRSGWRQEAVLSPAAGRSFGAVVAIHGDRIAVSSDDGYRVYIYRREGGAWAEEAMLEGRGSSNGFGISLALNRDQLYVGAFLQNTSAGIDAGTVFVYTAGPFGWNREQQLVASDASAGDRLGWSLSVDDDTLLVGAIGDDHAGGVDAGSAYVFGRGPFGWNEKAKLLPGEAAYRFGNAVALSKDRLVVMAWKNDAYARGFGSVFARSGDAWELEDVLRVASVSLSRVALSGDAALLSAGRSTNQGFLFRREGTTWEERARLVSSGSTPGYQTAFGASVALRGSTAVITAPEDAVAAFSGAAFLYSVPERWTRRR